jgi:hypothetical protein
MAHAAASVFCQDEIGAFPRAAAAYGLRELARRAGVPAQLFRTWRLEFESNGSISVFVQPGTRKRIQFPQMSRRTWTEIREGAFRTSTVKWIQVPSPVRGLVTDLKIPFSSSLGDDVGPLFLPIQHDCIQCPVDLPASIALTLGRFEETLPGPRDQHGRFSAFSSVAWRDGFLHRPIVDEYGLALEQALTHLLPGWRPAEKRLRVKLGHDVDDIGIPFQLRSSIGHTVRRGRPLATLCDLAAVGLGRKTAYQTLLNEIVQLSLDRGLDSAVYWKASAPSPFDSGYELTDERNLAMRSAFQSHGVEMGVHPSYHTFNSVANLRAEISKLREWLGQFELGGRQDYLRWTPQTWVLWESLGMAYDASVGYADHIGFRAGTSHPYKPWLFSQDREANLLEIPLHAMDTTLLCYMKLDPGQALSKVSDLLARCRSVGGVFTLLWHHTNLMESRQATVYRQLLDQLAGSDAFDWRAHSYGAN